MQSGYSLNEQNIHNARPPNLGDIVKFRLSSLFLADRCKEVQQIREQHPNKIPVSISIPSYEYAILP